MFGLGFFTSGGEIEDRVAGGVVFGTLSAIGPVKGKSIKDLKKALMDGDVKKANLLLERNYILSGQVIEGKKYGSKLGYPTANIETKEEKIIPKDGIYKTSTTVDNKEYRSVTSIGDNPTFNETKKSIETFIVNFDKNIYGKAIKIAFEDFIRDQIKFDDIGDLKRQMSVDVEYIANSKE